MKFKVGQRVRILSMEDCLAEDEDYVVGDICEITSVNQGKTYVRDRPYLVATSDETDEWWFREDELEAIDE